MKSAAASRTIWIFVIIGTTFAAKHLQKYMAADVAQLVADLLSDQVMAVLVPVLATAGIAVKVSDRKVVKELMAAKPRVVDSKAEPKI